MLFEYSWKQDGLILVKIAEAGFSWCSFFNSSLVKGWVPRKGFLVEKFWRFNDLCAISFGSWCFLGRLKMINFIGAGWTMFYFSSIHREHSLVNTSVNFKWHADSILNSEAATWLHAEPKPAIHEQLAVNTQPYSFCRHTHTLYIIEDALCLWLGSTLNSKVNSRPEFLNVYHKFINTKQ